MRQTDEENRHHSIISACRKTSAPSCRFTHAGLSSSGPAGGTLCGAGTAKHLVTHCRPRLSGPERRWLKDLKMFISGLYDGLAAHTCYETVQLSLRTIQKPFQFQHCQQVFSSWGLQVCSSELNKFVIKNQTEPNWCWENETDYTGIPCVTSCHLWTV